MVSNDVDNTYRARVESLERSIQAKKQIDDKNVDLDVAILRIAKEINLQFAGWLVENVERQQKSPRELMNELFVLALQAK